MIDIHDGASVRNLERIQEDGPSARKGALGKGGTAALMVTALACVLFAGLALGARRTTSAPTKKVDPLSELAGKPGSSTVMPGEVTFPGILSDRTHPATALAAAGAGSVGQLPALQPPPALDKLPVVPLPARHALTQPFVIAKPKDKLSALADPATDPAGAGGPMAVSGTEGGWQVQVSSFRTTAEADAFVKQLRARGHKAHVQQANIPSRGTWYRVKVGPFANQLEATRYRTAFEAKEKIPGFVVKSGVDPH
jgi:DedD protein